MHQVTMLLTAAGAVEDYTDEVKDAIRANVASELGLGVDSVTVTVSAASVRIALAVGYSSADAAAAGQVSLAQKAGGSIMDASAFLSTNSLAVSVESIDQAPTVTSAVDDEPTGTTIIIGIIIGIATGAIVLVWGLRRHMKMKRSKEAEEAGAKPVRQQVEVEKGQQECTFHFVRASFIRTSGMLTLPSFKELEKKGALERLTIKFSSAFLGKIDRRKYCVVSHRWMDKGQPDADGVQMRAIQEFLHTQMDIEWVWFDFWCMPQGEKTLADKLSFKWMLENINVLYLSMQVLVLLDLSYLSRFWTQYESWLSLQVATANGLRPATDEERRSRTEIVPIYNTNSNMVDGLLAMWSIKTPEQAHALLSMPDVTVTNQSDKDEQLPKVLKFNDDVILAFHHEAHAMSDAASGQNAPSAPQADATRTSLEQASVRDFYAIGELAPSERQFYAV